MTPICKPETPQKAAIVFCLWNSWETTPSAEAAPLARARLAQSWIPSRIVTVRSVIYVSPLRSKSIDEVPRDPWALAPEDLYLFQVTIEKHINVGWRNKS